MNKLPHAPSSNTMPKYVETDITVRHSRPDKGFAFGTASVNGQTYEIFVGQKCHGEKDADGRWQKARFLTPQEGDVLEAKICTEVQKGKKPFAAFWKVVRNAPDPYAYLDDEHIDNDFDDDDVDDGPICPHCTCSPCRCEPEY